MRKRRAARWHGQAALWLWLAAAMSVGSGVLLGVLIGVCIGERLGLAVRAIPAAAQARPPAVARAGRSDGLPETAGPAGEPPALSGGAVLARRPDGLPGGGAVAGRDRVPGSRPPGAGAEHLHIPVLMYHEIGPVDHPLYVSPEEFAAQLDFLARAGYTTITLQQMQALLTGREAAPPRPIVLTFDDGYESFFQVAFPLLRRHGFTATVFPITGLVGQPRYLTWEQLRELRAAGMEIGAHSRTHPDLRQVGPQRLEAEVAGARRDEADHGIDALYFCYPSGKVDRQVEAAVRRAGYAGAVTTRWGVVQAGQDPFGWPRLRVLRGTSPQALGRLIEGALAASPAGGGL